MTDGESGNHEGSAFSRDLLASSQNVTIRRPSPRAALEAATMTWALGLLVWIWLHASLMVDERAFVLFASALDRPGPAWFEAAWGYLCIALATRSIQHAAIAGGNTVGEGGQGRSAGTILSVLAFASYSYHLFVLRWPWLSGAASADSRLTVWGATLSSTWKGMPLLAFGELIGIGILVTHATVGLLPTRRSSWVRRTIVTTAIVSYLCASTIVVVLATGRR